MTQLTEEIDARVPQAVESALGVKVLSAEWIKLGIINRVYRVETDGGRFVVKVFRSRMWPEEGKLEWLEKQLAVPAPRVATVVAHTIVWQYFSKETAARAKAAITAAGARAASDAPFAWLSLEQYAPDQAPELRLTLWPGGERELLARAHPHGAFIEWQKALPAA